MYSLEGIDWELPVLKSLKETLDSTEFGSVILLQK